MSSRRSTIVVKHDNGEIVGTGDHLVRKTAENLAALSALYQLDAIGAVGNLYKESTGC